MIIARLLLIVRDNVTTHPSLRLYKPQSCFLESDLMIIARLLLIVRDNVTTHPSLRLYKPQSCCLESDPMIIARLLLIVRDNVTTHPSLRLYKPQSCCLESDPMIIARLLLIVRDNVTTHHSLRLYKPQSCCLESDPMIIARLLLIVRDNVTTHPSLRLYKPHQSCFLESDPMTIARLLKAVLHNRSTSPLVSVQQNNANIYPIHCIYSGCRSRKNTLQSFVTMDLHSYFGVASSSKSVFASVGSSEDDSQSSDVESLGPNPPLKKHCSAKSKKSTQRNYNKKWEKDFLWLEYDHKSRSILRSVESRSLSHLKKTGGAWITKPFKNWKRVVEKVRAHSTSDSYIKHCEAELLAARARKEGSFIIQQLQIIGEQERMVSMRFFFVPIFLHGSTFLTLLILINWLIWSCPVVVKI